MSIGWLIGYEGWGKRKRNGVGMVFIEVGIGEGERLVWRKIINLVWDILYLYFCEIINWKYWVGIWINGFVFSKEVWIINIVLGIIGI